MLVRWAGGLKLRRLEFVFRRRGLDITQRQFEVHMRWASGILGLLENGVIRMEEGQWDEFDTILDTIVALREKRKECVT